MSVERHPNARSAQRLADLFCRASRRRIKGLFHALWRNDDVFQYQISKEVLKGDFAWTEAGILEGLAPYANRSAETEREESPTPVG